jgi:hypothetical protein
MSSIFRRQSAMSIRASSDFGRWAAAEYSFDRDSTNQRQFCN